jgi:ABC-type glycerol-3-phosphate transport system substrate-binding protein
MGKARLCFAAIGASVLATFALAACGGDDDGGSEDEDQITAAIERAATSTDPSKCTEVETIKFIQETDADPGDSPEEALRKCQQNVGGAAADSVDVSEIEVDGDSATARALVSGSFFDGQTLDLALIKDGDQWKLDEINGFTDFDPSAMASAVGEGLSQDGAGQQAIDCVSNRIESLPADQVEAAFSENDRQAEDAIFEPCSRFFNE